MHYYVVFIYTIRIVCFRIIAEAKVGFLFSQRGVPILLSCIQEQCLDPEISRSRHRSYDLGVPRLLRKIINCTERKSRFFWKCAGSCEEISKKVYSI